MKFFALIFIVLGSSLFAQQDAGATTSLDAEYHQFQFLIGDWDIQSKTFDAPTGKLLLEKRAWQHAKYLDEKRMIFDQWTSYTPSGEKLTHGVTLRAYSKVSGQWQNAYLSSFPVEPPSDFVTKWQDNEMEGQGSWEHPRVGTIQFKIRFFDITTNRYKWEQKLSIDDGKTWHLERSYIANRRRE